MGNPTISDENFRCPVCLGTKSRRVVVPRANGAAYETSFYSCAGCTTMFLDARLFASRGDPARFIEEQRHEKEVDARVWEAIRDVPTDAMVEVEYYHFDYTHFTY